MKLIGLNGRMHSGKDTAYEILRDVVYPLRTQRICFADKMKLSGVRALGYDPVDTKDAVRIADIIKEQGRVQVTVGGKPMQLLTLSATERYYGEYDTVPPPEPSFAFDISGREFWQRYGTEAHREVYGQDFHVDALLPRTADKLEEWFPNVDVLVETTTRFHNEAERVLGLGGTVWHIDADERLGPLPEGSHISEQPLPPDLTTLVLKNNLDLDQFKVAVASAWALVNDDVYGVIS